MRKICTRCRAEKPLGEFYTNGKKKDGSNAYRPDCKACHTSAKRVPPDQKKYNGDPCDEVFRLCKRMAHDARSRVLAPSRSHKSAYKNLNTPFGFSSSRDMYLYLYKEFRGDIEELLREGKRPSVDRIDTTTGYTPGNIRVLDRRENTLRGVESIKRKVEVLHTDGSTTTYESVTKCAEVFDTTDGHVRGWINGKWRPNNGCTFKYAQ